MPELPEVEPHCVDCCLLTNQLIYSLTLRRRTLRWDIP
ncbi:DNA-formamidopyrimidine glycosylase, partial [Xylella fastidiosa]